MTMNNDWLKHPLLQYPKDVLLSALNKLLAEQDFSEFCKQAWGVVEPGRKLVWGWHLQAKCDHLQAVYNFTVPPEVDPGAKAKPCIQDIIINEPPRCSKTLFVSVLFNAWVWTKWPGARFLYVTYADDLTRRDALKCRKLVESAWYQERWPLRISDDQRSVGRYNIQARDQAKGRWVDTGGYRVSTTILGVATGEGGDFRVLDDPHNVKKALSDIERKQAITFIDLTLPTRVVDPKRSSTVICMQRLHKQDATGHVLEGEAQYDILCLPMEYEAPRERRELDPDGKERIVIEGGNRCSTALGFVDPRSHPGELLHPERWDRESVEQLKAKLRMTFGEFGVSSQLQQRPVALGGGLFKPDNLVMVAEWPGLDDLENIVRYWDRAGTQGSGCNTSGCLMARRKSTQRTIILDIARGQLGPGQRETLIRDTSHMDLRRLGLNLSAHRRFNVYSVRVEGEPGSDGAYWTVINLAGFDAKAIPKRVSKEADWAPLASMVNLGAVEMVVGPWNTEAIREMQDAPFSTFKDDLDSMSGAFKHIWMSNESWIA